MTRVSFRPRAVFLSMVLLVASAGLACNPSSSSAGIGAAMEVAISASPRPESIDFRDLTSRDWDRVVVFGPYTTQAMIAKTLGFSWSSSDTKEIEASDSANLVVFLKDGEVIDEEMIPRAIVDFTSEHLPLTLTPDNAILELRWDGDVPIVVN